jgi:hypothetical protein
VEARADDVQLGLSKGALHAEYEGVVEFGRSVYAIFVDHERSGDGAQFEQAMPVLVRARQPRCFQREDRTDVAHRHIANQGLEVRAGTCRSTGLAEIAVEDPDLFLAPAEHSGFAHQVVLAIRALLIEAHLRQRRLADVDAGLLR